MKKLMMPIIIFMLYSNKAKSNEKNVINERFVRIANSINECETTAKNLCTKQKNPEKCWKKHGKDCYKKEVAKNINHYVSLIKEKKDKLILKIDNKNNIILKNCSFEDCKWEAVDYELITYIPEINYYVVRMNLNERERIIFINQKNGKEFYFSSCNFYDGMLIKFSPDYKRFACLNVSDSYRDSNLSMARIEKEGLVEEYERKAFYWSKSVEWIDNETLKYNYDEPKKEVRELVSKYKIIEYKNGKWKEGKEQIINNKNIK